MTTDYRTVLPNGNIDYEPDAWNVNPLSDRGWVPLSRPGAPQGSCNSCEKPTQVGRFLVTIMAKLSRHKRVITGNIAGRRFCNVCLSRIWDDKDSRMETKIDYQYKDIDYPFRGNIQTREFIINICPKCVKNLHVYYNSILKHAENRFRWGVKNNIKLCGWCSIKLFQYHEKTARNQSGLGYTHIDIPKLKKSGLWGRYRRGVKARVKK